MCEDKMIYKTCPRCGRKIEVGKHCPCESLRHQRYKSKRTDDEEQAFYKSGRWKRVREATVESDLGVCRLCYNTHAHPLPPAEVVHHIVPIKDGGAKLDTHNLISLCNRCHGKVHDRYKNGFERETIERLKMIPPVTKNDT